MADRPASVHLARFAPADSLVEGLSSETLKRLDNWDLLIRVRSTVLKVLEEARQAKFIGNSLEAKVTLSGDDVYATILKSYEAMLPALLIVSQVELGAPSGETSFSGEVEGLRASVSRAEGKKCERCWIYSTEVGSNPDFPGLCPRCASILEELGVTPDQLDPVMAKS
jgi:isoleucyl-tRNA synthetase